MSPKVRNTVIIILLIPAAVIVAVLGLVLFNSLQPLPPVPSLPSPNGYNAFIKAGDMVTSNVSDYVDLNPDELQQVVNENSNALQLARRGLTQECRVPLDYSATSSAHLDQLSNMKRLANALAAEGRLAEIQNHPGDAAKSYLDLIQLGIKSAHGGVIIDGLVGMALENLGVSDLKKIAGKLDAESCRKAAARLETLDAHRTSWPEILRQEKAWSRRTFPGFKFRLAALLTRGTLTRIYRRSEQKFKEHESRTRQLMVDLAARAYQLDKGHQPASITDLVPDYLKAIPKDPLTGSNMVYSPR
ncbi:MAG TPA: hypothetical protein VKA67_10585 [Verrucomicrobiae bacterium]|nr:hypothetical protein [Verrucomicrobiae bacterium]